MFGDGGVHLALDSAVHCAHDLQQRRAIAPRMMKPCGEVSPEGHCVISGGLLIGTLVASRRITMSVVHHRGVRPEG